MKRVWFVIGLVIFIILPVVVVPHLVVIKNITCQSQFGQCSDYIMQSFNSQIDKRLIEAQKGLEEILVDQVNVKSYSTNLKLPNTLNVEIVERKPMVILTKPDEGIKVYVDQEGIIVGNGGNDLAELTLGGEYKPTGLDPGSSIPQELLFAAYMVRELDKNFDYQEGLVSGGKLTVKLEGKQVIFPLEGDSQLLLGSLQIILTRADEQDSPYSEIDLRYKNPILR